MGILACKRERQECQEVKIIFSYVGRLRAVGLQETLSLKPKTKLEKK